MLFLVGKLTESGLSFWFLETNSGVAQQGVLRGPGPPIFWERPFLNLRKSGLCNFGRITLAPSIIIELHTPWFMETFWWDWCKFQTSHKLYNQEFTSDYLKVYKTYTLEKKIQHNMLCRTRNIGMAAALPCRSLCC